jgi:2-furoyl-CoA dehydrogenase large subunit
MNLRLEDLRFAGGRIFAAANPENSLSFARVAAASHWFAGSLPDPEPSALRARRWKAPSRGSTENRHQRLSFPGAAYG